MAKNAYPDLIDSEFVFEALLGHGMFTSKLPPCFSSVSLFDYVKNNTPDSKINNHAYVEYKSTRNTNVPRLLAVPHPESYIKLCQSIKEYWSQINEHIGMPANKFNFCHVRKIKDKKIIFEMNYEGSDKWGKEELELDYALGCKYVVLADISTFFPSVYAHSIPWAAQNKEWAKQHQCTSDSNKKKNKGANCGRFQNQPCPHEKIDLWSNDLDKVSRSVKDGETNGLLIGPHSSNIISEIILTKVDVALQQEGFTKVIRHIDDYTFFAKNETEANEFLRTLNIELKKYELTLNAKKTSIIPYQSYVSKNWISKLSQFIFPDRDTIGYTSINAYIDYSMLLSKECNDYAVLNYALKVISQMKLSKRAKRLFIKKICQISIQHPYIVPLLEDNVFKFADGDYSFLNHFLNSFLPIAVETGSTDSIAYILYFSIKYGVKLEDVDWDKIISLNDCVSILLAYKNCEHFALPLKQFTDEANKILNLPSREQDKFWLFIYETLPKSKLKGFMKNLKEAGVSFYVHPQL